MSAMDLDAPFPYFGGKSHYVDVVWARLGDVDHYVEPFFGSGAVLLGRPDAHQPATRLETVNDADGLLANVWRAIQADPDAVAHHATWPVNECDLHARHLWLLGQRDRITERLMADADWYDAKAAGWWVWGACSWIGNGWCAGKGPWQAVDGVLTKTTAGRGVHRQLPHLADTGRGVHRQLPHLSNTGRGVHRQLPHLSNTGQGVHRRTAGPLTAWFAALAARLARVRVVCGDWSRIVGPAVLDAPNTAGPVGVFLDPPYHQDQRDIRVYAVDSDVAEACRAWAVAHQDRPNLRIALAGYYTADDLPGWSVVAGLKSAAGSGYGNQGNGRGRENYARDAVWFSPQCLAAERPADLFTHAGLEVP